MKTILIVVIIIMLFSIVGCQQVNDEIGSDASNNTGNGISVEANEEMNDVDIEYIFPHEGVEHEGTCCNGLTITHMMVRLNVMNQYGLR